MSDVISKIKDEYNKAIGMINNLHTPDENPYMIRLKKVRLLMLRQVFFLQKQDR